MESASASKHHRRVFRTRILFFLLGAVVNYLLIATPFKWLTQHTAMAVWQKSACSIAVSTAFFFLWNYFVNFRTDSRKRVALARYLAVVIVMYFLSTGLLTLFKHTDMHFSFQLGRFPLDLDVIATQACQGWLKFLLYHFWAFPPPKRQPQA